MQVNRREHLPISIPILTSEQKTTSSSIHSDTSIDLQKSNSTSPCYSKPKLMHPEEVVLVQGEDSSSSMEQLLVNGQAASEEYMRDTIKYLYDKQSILMRYMLQQKQKINELQQSSHSMSNQWASILDIALPLCSGIIAIYLGFSPDYSLSKLAAICSGVVGFSIAGLQLGKVPLANSISNVYMTLFNLYMAYINPRDILTLVTNFLQLFPIISGFVSNVDQNSIQSEEALAQKAIKCIDLELKKVATEISRMVKMMAENKRFFSITTDYNQLQGQITGMSPV